MRRHLILVVRAQMKNILFILLVMSTAALAGGSAVPVKIGSIPDMDACLSLGVVSGLQHSVLSVRSGPSTTTAKIDSLHNGQSLWLCDSSSDGKWHGVIYVHGKDTPECGLSSPVSSEKPYTGLCKSGWVHKTWVKVIAG